MPHTSYLAVDLGAESGRGVVVSFDGERLALREVARFPTGRGPDDVGPDGVRRWDVERLWAEIERAYHEALRQEGRNLRGVGVDSWGVDFGLLDARGRLLEPPVHYRDADHAPAMERALSVLPRAEVWDATGIQFLPFNSLYQLLARHQRRPDLLEQARHFCMIPDLMHHRLTRGGALGVEATNASTTQMVNARTGRWETGLLERLGMPSHFLGAITPPGTRLGETAEGVPVYAPATHDTGSAVAAAPAAPGTRWAFLSSGTWSLLGVEQPEPNLSREAMAAGLSNERGASGVRLLRNIMGLWLVQECRRVLRDTEGHETSYADLTALAAEAPQGGPVIDATDARFIAPADMVEEIHAACRETGQSPPHGVGPLVRCCLESLALAYRQQLDALHTLTGQRIDALHIVGGGSRNETLNQWTADACGIPVLAGPEEATAIGNALGQLIAAGEIRDWADARGLVARSFPRREYPARGSEAA